MASFPHQPISGLCGLLLDGAILERINAADRTHEAFSWDVPGEDLPVILESVFDIDSLVLRECGRWGEIRVARGELQTTEWIAQSTPTPKLIRELYAEGFSIVINNLQDKIHRVFQLCQELGSLWIAGVNCNAYLTPPATQGLAKHYDDEDVMVLQVSGAKTWRLYRPPQPLNPLAGTPYSQSHVDACQTAVTHHLSRGKALYIPRGVPHEAYCTDEASVHFTFSLQATSRGDLIRELIDAAISDPCDAHGFRLHLETDVMRRGFISENGLSHIAASLRALTDGLEAGIVNRALSALVRKRLQGMATPMLFGHSSLVTDLCEETGLALAPEQALIRSAETKKAHFKGGTIDLDTDAAATVVDRLASGHTVHARDLPGADEDERIQLARQLMDCGLLTRA